MFDSKLKNLIPGLLTALFLVAAPALGTALVGCGGDEGGESHAAAENPAEDAHAGHDHAAEEGGSDSSHPVELAQGAEIDITQHLAEGQITVVDFYSEYCGPCRQIAPYLLKLHQGREDITVVKVDINRPGVRGIDWGSPVAKQYGLNSIPHLKVYDPAGRLLAEGREAMGLVQGYLEGKS